MHKNSYDQKKCLVLTFFAGQFTILSNLFLVAFSLVLFLQTFLCLPNVFARIVSSSARVKAFTISTPVIPTASIIGTTSSTIPVTISVIVFVIAKLIICPFWTITSRWWGSRCHRSSTHLRFDPVQDIGCSSIDSWIVS